MNHKKKVLLFYVVFFLFVMAVNLAHPITPTFFHDLQLKSYMFGVALGALQFTSFLFSPFWGKLSDYIPARYTIFLSTLGYAFAQFLFSRATAEYQIIIARMIGGVFSSGAFVTIMTYLVDISRTDAERAEYLAVFATVQAVAAAFGYLAGGFIGEISVSLTFMMQIIFVILGGFLFFIITKPDENIIVEKIDAKELLKESNPLKAFIDVGKFINVVMVTLFALCTLQYLGGICFDQTFNYYIKDQFQFTPGMNGSLKGIMGILTLLVNSTITLLILRKTNIRKSSIALFGVASLVMGFVILFNSQKPFVVSYIVFHTIYNMTLPLTQTLVADQANINYEYRNIILGFYNSMKSLGSIFGSLLAGFLYALYAKLPFIFATGIYILCTVLSVVYYRQTKKISWR